MDPVIDATVRAALSLLLVVAAAHKLRDLRRFRATFAEYRLLPGALAPAAALMLPAVELTLGAALLVPSLRTSSLLGAACLLALYGAAIAVNLARGRRHIDCGCAGPARPIGGWLVARNAALAATALSGFVAVHPRPLVWLDLLTIAATTAFLAAAYAALDGMIASAPAVGRLRESA